MNKTKTPKWWYYYRTRKPKPPKGWYYYRTRKQKIPKGWYYYRTRKQKIQKGWYYYYRTNKSTKPKPPKGWKGWYYYRTRKQKIPKGWYYYRTNKWTKQKPRSGDIIIEQENQNHQRGDIIKSYMPGTFYTALARFYLVGMQRRKVLAVSRWFATRCNSCGSEG